MTVRELVDVTKCSNCDILVVKNLEYKGVTKPIELLTVRTDCPETTPKDILDCVVESLSVHNTYNLKVILEGCIFA